MGDPSLYQMNEVAPAEVAGRINGSAGQASWSLRLSLAGVPAMVGGVGIWLMVTDAVLETMQPLGELTVRFRVTVPDAPAV